MTDEQVTALTRLEGSNPEEVAALARKTMELAVANVKLAAAETSANELRRAVAEIIGADPETWPNHGNAPLAIAAYVAVQQAELAALEAKLAALASQEPVMIYEGRCIFDCGDGGHQDVTMLKMIPKGAKLYRAAGAAPVHKEPVAWMAWNSQHHCYDYGEASETDALGRVVEYLYLEGEV